MKISIDRTSRIPVYIQIEEQVKEMILRKELIDGMKLPSERFLSGVLGVHRNTISHAYNELKAEGFVESKQGVGYIIAKGMPGEVKEQRGGHKVNWLDSIKNEYLDYESTFDDIFISNQEKGVISFGGGMASPDVFSEKRTAKIFKDILSSNKRQGQYFTPYRGDRELRRALIGFLGTKGIHATERNIQIMSEMNQALDFIVTLLISPGDTVIMEEPISPDVYRPFKLAGAEVFTVPVDEDGMTTDFIEEIIKLKKPKLIFVNGGYHDPCGVLTSLERRKVLLGLSDKYKIPIIEEDESSDLHYEGERIPTLKSMDKYSNVIYIYTFQFTFIPGLSMAFIVGDTKLIDCLSNLVSNRLMSLNWMTQKMMAGYLSEGSITNTMEVIRTLYVKKRDVMGEYLEELLPLGLSYSIPKGGVYYWCKLPEGLTSKGIYNQAKHVGITFIPGEIFYPKGKKGYNMIRLNFSFESIERIEDGMQKFVEIVRKAVLVQQ